MKMKNTKISNAGYRVLEILKELTNRPLSPDEMLLYLESATNNLYRKELALKYLNTLKLLNIDIEKIEGKYFIKRGIECIDPDKNDLSVMLFIRKYIDTIGHESFKNNIEESLQIIERCFSNKVLDCIKTHTIKPYIPKKSLIIKDENVKKFEKYCHDGLGLELKYENYQSDNKDNLYKIAPLKVVYKRGKAVLIAYDQKDNDYKEFVLENITDVKQKPQKQVKGSPSSVLFKLKGRLAKSYMLKKGEMLLETGDDFIIISNRNEDRELLIRRLLRYYDKCEILYPKTCRERIVELINEMEAMYA